MTKIKLSTKNTGHCQRIFTVENPDWGVDGNKQNKSDFHKCVVTHELVDQLCGQFTIQDRLVNM